MASRRVVGVRVGESAYARPRYAICANVLIAAVSGEHKRAEAGREKSRVSSRVARYSADETPRRDPRRVVRPRVQSAVGAHTRACRTRADAHRDDRVSPAAMRRFSRCIAAPGDCNAMRWRIDTRGV